MNILLSLVGFGAIVVAWGHYLWLIPAERVPVRPIAHSATMGIGLVLTLLAVARSMSEEAALGTPLLLGLFAVLLTGLFYYLLVIATLPAGERTVRVGQPLPLFQAIDDKGVLINSKTWRGQRMLLKFFRGSW